MPVPAGVPVFAVDAVPAPGRFLLDGPEGRHAATVRRLRVGEELVVTDGSGLWALGRVAVVGRSELAVDITDVRAEPPPPIRVTVVQALPKGERADLAIELATEAGADVVVPWAAERCVARWVGDDKAERGSARWRQVAREAAKQARRTWFPQVERLHGTDQLVDRVAAVTTGGGTALVLHESATTPFGSLPLPTAGDLLLIVGPEGGVSDMELELLTTAGASAVRLGPEVLRTSTAAAVALGALGALRRWS